MPPNHYSDHQNVDQIRQFNRFYTRQIGLLNDCFLGKPFSLPEIRILYEISRQDSPTAGALAEYLRMDPASVSRILSRLLKQGLLQRQPDRSDRRRKRLQITPQGAAELEALNRLSQEHIGSMIAPLTQDQREELVAHMNRIHQLLQPETASQVLIRPLRMGDIGTIINRHAVLYAREQGWDEGFERTLLEVLTAFVSNRDRQREQGWVAEVDGLFAGSVFAVKEDTQTARLRALLVEPQFRGLNIGRQLIEQCIDFCRQSGYRQITLWTCSALTQARKLYQKAGFSLIESWQEDTFGQTVTSERWDMPLS